MMKMRMIMTISMKFYTANLYQYSCISTVFSLLFPVATSNWSGTVDSNWTREPEFSIPIGNLTTPVGREAVLSCTVDHLGKHKVGWLRAEDQTVLSLHTSLVTHNPRISLTHDNYRSWQLHIRQVKESDRGCYMCQVNTRIMKKQIGCLDVHVPPDIIYQETSGDLAVLEGDNATLVCQATGHPPPRVTWRREDGIPIFLKQSSRETIRVESYNGSRLSLWKVDRRQMGTYLCIASNDIPPAVSKRITLQVNFPPHIHVPNQLLGAPLGTDVLLECHVEAFPNTITYWLRNRSDMLMNGGRKYWTEEKKDHYKVIMQLVIHGFKEADIGTYNCVATNSLGKAEGTLRLYGLGETTKRYNSGSNNRGHLKENSIAAAPAAVSGIYQRRINLLIISFYLVFR
ncbi:lachesin-like [Lycorma delicatula]|uniref:lachesin-like n=1 Tax=Lycorma delicatula TaxID=130591 RepID=UPI003F50F96E